MSGAGLFFLFVLGVGGAGGLGLELRANPKEQAIVMMADLTKAGKSAVHPDREHPQYYRPVFFPYEEKGPPLKAWERKPDNETELRTKIALMLASQGYLPANETHPPTLVISFEWGTIAPIYAQRSGPGNSADPNPLDPDLSRQYCTNADEIRALILGSRSADAELSSTAFGAYTADMKTLRPRHYLVISAFQYQPGPHKREILLWTVHTTANPWNNYLKEMMPEFIKIAAAGVGRDVTPRPVFKELVPHVEIGEATVKTEPSGVAK